MTKFVARWFEILGIIFLIIVCLALFTTIMMKVFDEGMVFAVTEKLGIIFLISVCLAIFTTIMMQVFGELTIILIYVIISIIMSGILIYIFPV
jgi:hypothetical protein